MVTRFRFTIIMAALLLLSGTASAGLFRTGNNIRVDADTSIDENFNAAASTVDIWGYVSGDVVAACRYFSLRGSVGDGLFVAAQRIDLDGEVAGNILLFAQNIDINSGPVSDVRVACQHLNIDTEVMGDILAAAQSIEIDSRAVVHGDVAMAAQDIEINGNIQGKVVAGGQWIEIGGTIQGDAELYVDELAFHGDGLIDGDLLVRYSDEKPEIDESRVNGTISYQYYDEEDELESSPWPFRVWSLLAGIVTGLLLVLAFKKCLAPDLKEGMARPWRSLGFGFLMYAVIPIAILIGFVLVLTVPIGVTLLAIYGPLLYAGWIIGSLIAGYGLLAALTKSEPSYYTSVLVGVILVWVIGLIPVLGALVVTAVTLIGGGVILFGSLRMIKSE